MLTILAWALSPAWACGGFFCSTVPVEQAAERVVFAVDEDTQTTEMHVQVQYQGAAPEFAWIVPVSSVPKLFVSEVSLFASLGTATRPIFQLNQEEEGYCAEPFSFPSGAMLATYEDDRWDTGVTVLDFEQVGPYDTVVLQASSSASLVEWLQDNDFQIPDTLAPVLQPYVAADQYFVALRLSKGNTTGDLRPLGLRYAGTRPSIPIQLTSVAATPDMRLEVYIFGRHRYVPENYLHVQINEAAIDWASGGTNYADVITQAADAAGGQAFATDYAGRPIGTGPYTPPDLRHLEDETVASALIQGLREAGVPGSSPVIWAFMEYIPMPDGVELEPIAFYDALAAGDTSWDEAIGPVDAERLVEELTDLLTYSTLFYDFARHPVLTRLTSSLSAAEMTVDPVFVPNPDLPMVSNVHQATLVLECNGRTRNAAPRRFEFANGSELVMPSSEAMSRMQMSDAGYLATLDLGGAAERVERTATAGAPVLVQDNLPAILAALDANNRGCGCDGGAGSVGGIAVVAAIALRRRRSR